MRFSYLSAIVLTSALAALATNAFAADWPQFRGPARDEVSKETGLLQAWPKEGPPLAWQAKGLGAGFSSVSVVGGKIFTAGDLGDASYVVALKESDGTQIWKSRLGAPGGGSGYPGTRATPTVDGETLYMLGQHGDLVAYAVADGKELWRKDLNKDFAGRMMSGWGNSESPLIEGDKLLCTPGGKGGTVLALNKKTGEPLWRSKELTDSAAYSSLVAADIGGVRQVVVLTDRSVAGVAVADGKLLWRQERSGETAVAPTPVVRDNLIYVTSGYGAGCNLIRVSVANNQFSAEEVYASKAMSNHHGGVLLVGDCIYGFAESKGWTCQDLKTGDVKWKDKELLGKGTLTCADGRFYLREENAGTLVLLEATPDAHTERGRFAQPQRTNKNAWAHLVIANGKLYVRDQDVLLCYDVRREP